MAGVSAACGASPFLYLHVYILMVSNVYDLLYAKTPQSGLPVHASVQH